MKEHAKRLPNPENYQKKRPSQVSSGIAGHIDSHVGLLCQPRTTHRFLWRSGTKTERSWSFTPANQPITTSRSSVSGPFSKVDGNVIECFKSRVKIRHSRSPGPGLHHGTNEEIRNRNLDHLFYTCKTPASPGSFERLRSKTSESSSNNRDHRRPYSRFFLPVSNTETTSRSPNLAELDAQ